MGKVVLDDVTGARLATVGNCVELCNAQGKVLGYFTPVPSGAPQPLLTEEEIALRRAEKEVFTLKEVMDHLRSL
jgi:hypothetical protein